MKTTLMNVGATMFVTSIVGLIAGLSLMIIMGGFYVSKFIISKIFSIIF
jgi:hypothetical protein